MTTTVLPPTSAAPTSTGTSTGTSASGRAAVLGQAARFLVVGGVATVVDVGLFNVLHYVAGVGPLSSKVASTVVAGVVAFVGNRQWSFGGTGAAASRVHAQALAFVAVNAAALLLALLPLAVARYALGLTGVVALNIAGNVVGLALATALRFEGYRRWVFVAPTAVPADGGRTAPVTARPVRRTAGTRVPAGEERLRLVA